MQKQTFSISGISCGSCVTKIESSFGKTETFNFVKVLRGPDRLTIESEKEMTAQDINELFEKLDLSKYKALDFQPEKVEHSSDGLFTQLYPLALVISYIFLTVIVVAWSASDFTFDSMMFHYMAGFFLVFSFFKFLNLEGFVDAFQTYDPLAKRWRPYGYFYASFELFAGVGYLTTPKSILLNSLVLLLFSISSWGVVKAVKSKSRIQCACLGTIFNLPMTKVTIVENISMITMAALVILKTLHQL